MFPLSRIIRLGSQHEDFVAVHKNGTQIISKLGPYT